MRVGCGQCWNAPALVMQRREAAARKRAKQLAKTRFSGYKLVRVWPQEEDAQQWHAELSCRTCGNVRAGNIATDLAKQPNSACPACSQAKAKAAAASKRKAKKDAPQATPPKRKKEKKARTKSTPLQQAIDSQIKEIVARHSFGDASKEQIRDLYDLICNQD